MGSAASTTGACDAADAATRVFRQRQLKGKVLAVLQATRSDRGESTIVESVMDAAELRAALGDLGDDVSSKAYFELCQAADPDSEGHITLPRFLEVVELRRTQRKQEMEEEQLLACYMALGGNADKDKSVASAPLIAATSDFVGAKASRKGLLAVEVRKMKSVQELLAMGGALDDEEEAELRDTTTLEFEDVRAFAQALAKLGGAAFEGREAADDDDDDGAVASTLTAAGAAAPTADTEEGQGGAGRGPMKHAAGTSLAEADAKEDWHAEAARSLGVSEVRGGGSGGGDGEDDGGEAKAAGVEELFKRAWSALARGDCAAATVLATELLGLNNKYEKAFYTRAVAHCRAAKWRAALADYSQYLQLLQLTSGAALADALYGRALCLAKSGHRRPCKRDLDECVRVHPEGTDEQLTDKDISFVPHAVVARFVMCQACPELAEKDDTQQPSPARAAAAEGEEDGGEGGGGRSNGTGTAAAAAEAMGAPELTTTFEGPLWRAAVTEMEGAIERAYGAGKAPLLLDTSREHCVDLFFLYQPCTTIEAKRLVLDVRVAGLSLEAARERLRKLLVDAMRHGHTLLIQMGNSAADFVGTYCCADCFPDAIFTHSALPSGKDCAADPTFSKVLREADTDGAGRFFVPPSFRVAVSSHFGADSYARLLAGSLPLEALRPVQVYQPARRNERERRARAGAGGGGSGGQGGTAATHMSEPTLTGGLARAAQAAVAMADAADAEAREAMAERGL
jgi:tetratricopeptide (TPR) repeat protein